MDGENTAAPKLADRNVLEDEQLAYLAVRNALEDAGFSQESCDALSTLRQLGDLAIDFTEGLRTGRLRGVGEWIIRALGHSIWALMERVDMSHRDVIRDLDAYAVKKPNIGDD